MTEQTQSPPSVLVVDDTPANLVALGAVLRPLDVRIVEAQSGEEAIARAAEESFAVALLDVQMPGMDGFELARRLRSMETATELPIIFLTAIHREEEYARRGYAVGGADYITKPFDADVLRARVRAFVDLYRQGERLRLEQVGARTRERDDALEQLATMLRRERAARQEAEVANRAKDEFLATVSHELRTPLSAILGWSAIAKRAARAPEAIRALASIERNARAQLRIIEDVLDVGRIVGGQLRLQLAPVDVEEAIRGAVDAVAPAAESKQVAVEVAVAQDVGVIEADAARLEQIVWNVLSNAIKFTPSGGHVDVAAWRTPTAVVLRITDDGQGIRPEFLPHLFEKFRQGDATVTRRHGGLGLGLAIVRHLTDAHGGTVTASSAGEGKGATFTIELPARPMSEGTMRIARDARAAPRTERRLRGMRVLVVDDDEDSRELLQLLLDEHGATVVSASSASEALAAIDEEAPHVLLSDIGMPNASGYELIQDVRRLDAARGGALPAVALTAYARPEDGERAFAAGFDAYLTKPIDPERLVAVIANVAWGRFARPRARASKG